MPFQVAAFLLNEKRNAITKIELRTRARIFILPDDHLETPHFEVQRLRDDSPELVAGQTSYEMPPSSTKKPSRSARPAPWSARKQQSRPSLPSSPHRNTPKHQSSRPSRCPSRACSRAW